MSNVHVVGGTTPDGTKCPVPLCTACVLSLRGIERQQRMEAVMENLHSMHKQVKLMWLCYFEKAVTHPERRNELTMAGLFNAMVRCLTQNKESVYAQFYAASTLSAYFSNADAVAKHKMGPLMDVIAERLEGTYILARKELCILVAKLADHGVGCRDGGWRSRGVLQLLMRLSLIGAEELKEEMTRPGGQQTKNIIKPGCNLQYIADYLPRLISIVHGCAMMALSGIVGSSIESEEELLLLASNEELVEHSLTFLEGDRPEMYPESSVRHSAAVVCSCLCHIPMLCDPASSPLPNLHAQAKYIPRYTKIYGSLIRESMQDLYLKMDACFEALNGNPCMEDAFPGKEHYNRTVGEHIEYCTLVLGILVNFSRCPDLATHFQPEVIEHVGATLKNADFQIVDVHSAFGYMECTLDEREMVQEVPHITHFSPCSLGACLILITFLNRHNGALGVPPALLGTQETTAMALKASGNDEFKAKHYEVAAWIYSSALLLLPPADTFNRCVLLSNRAECFLRLEKAQEALADCDAALEMNAEHEKTLKRKERAQELLAES